MFKLTQIDMTGQQDTNGNSSTHISQSTTIAYSRSNSSAYGDLETPWSRSRSHRPGSGLGVCQKWVEWQECVSHSFDGYFRFVCVVGESYPFMPVRRHWATAGLLAIRRHGEDSASNSDWSVLVLAGQAAGRSGYSDVGGSDNSIRVLVASLHTDDRPTRPASVARHYLVHRYTA